jgi:hypothetical protein
MTLYRKAVAVAVGSLFAGAVFAQSHAPIEQRDRMQQHRIDRGVQSGQITSQEAARLQGERNRIERLEGRARADGNLSRQERSRIDHAQDRLGGHIYREAHDRQAANTGGHRGHGSNGWNRRNDHRQGGHDGRPQHSGQRDGARGDHRDHRGWQAAAPSPRANDGGRDGRGGRDNGNSGRDGRHTR